MKQTIEVEVVRVDEGHCRVTWADGRRERIATIGEVEGYGLTVPEPTPERTEYRLFVVGIRGLDAPADEVLVAAHSLRVGDRIEWAPGDWREITEVELTDPVNAVYTFSVGERRAIRRGFDLLAVRRS